jgi:hypothetical protein
MTARADLRQQPVKTDSASRFECAVALTGRARPVIGSGGVWTMTCHPTPRFPALRRMYPRIAPNPIR